MIDLRQLYLDDLGKIVNYSGKHPRPRVRYIKKWNDLPTIIKEGHGIDSDDFDKTWVWSDQHFGHENIIDFTGRPYPNADVMNQCIADNFNDYVGKNDTSIWVGDVTFMGNTPTNEILDTLNGYKILVVGNHDFTRKKRIRNLNFDEIHLFLHLSINETDMMFTHYPMDNLPYPIMNIHGHIHDQILDSPQHINVSVEMPYINYKPIPLTILHNMCKSRIIEWEDSQP